MNMGGEGMRSERVEGLLIGWWVRDTVCGYWGERLGEFIGRVMSKGKIGSGWTLLYRTCRSVSSRKTIGIFCELSSRARVGSYSTTVSAKHV
ncbi:hypothetical protein HBH64_205280 [Parastagonospora nodorum]|nr:hypothetical protein HBH53_201230 [Parastagonospora nodorum]KAH3992875.1 hypothetical protein HBI10_209740 [Parastagonospora nodorum]KAH4149750.1 hypothetical protein HBH44_189170 [Parastagonospora nodorum]KAH4229500.1 hypothetical protein HBI05_196640 [Parastagonospora nodorum]KAH4289849.1 hypothetical protein HBI01_207160 [Parastagonospora nodorum]